MTSEIDSIKFFITGTKRGLGKELANQFNCVDSLLDCDVFINCNDLLHRLQNSAEKYTVFGLSGATTCKVKEPALWHLMSERQDQRGCVAHGNKELYHYTSFCPLPMRSLVIDGVFLGINIKKFNRDVRFDESYPSHFHYYDIDFCLECNKNNVIINKYLK